MGYRLSLVCSIFVRKLGGMRYTFLTFILIFSFQFASAQNGQITVQEDEDVSDLIDRFVEINEATTTVDGWRIQLLATSDRAKVESAKRKFQTLYPNISVDWTHSKPYYKLRAGAFNTKLEATRLLYVLKRDYPTAYPAKDDSIKPEELLN